MGQGATLRLVGLQSEVDVAAAAIRALLSTTTTKRQAVPAAVRGAVVGTKGAVLMKLEEECGVTIDMNREKEEVAITGPTTSVNAALAQINDILSENEEATVEVELKGPHVTQVQSCLG